MFDLSSMSLSYALFMNSIFLHHSSSLYDDLQDKNGSAVRRKAIADYKLEGDGHNRDPNENAVSGLFDDTVIGSRNQAIHLSDDRNNEIPLLTTEVTYPSFSLTFKETFCLHHWDTLCMF
jgi:hypothetical protein